VPFARTAALLRRFADAEAKTVADSPGGGPPRPYFGRPQPLVRPLRVWVTVKVRLLATLPATVIVAVRSTFVAFAATENSIEPGPVPDAVAGSISSHAALEVADHGQLPEAETVTSESPPAALIRRSSYPIVKVTHGVGVAETALDEAPAPIAFTARSAIEYAVPLVSPVIATGELASAGLSAVQFVPESSVYS